MIVLDASALVDVLVGTDSAPWVLDQLSGQTVCAPSHQPAEVLSATARLNRAGKLGEEAWGLALNGLASFEQELVEPSLANLKAAQSLTERIRVLDGLYVALAMQRALPLITTDERLVRSEPPCTILSPEGS